MVLELKYCPSETLFSGAWAETLGRRSLPKFGVGGTVHASVPPIFGEVVLRDSREKYEVTEKGEMKEFFCEI